MSNPVTNLYLKRERRVPSILAFGIIILMVYVLSSFFSDNPRRLQARPKTVSDIEVANLAHNQATIIWKTNLAETGWVIYGDKENKLTDTAFDDRDLEKVKGRYRLHYVNLKNLRANTRYFFKIISGNKLVSKDKSHSFSFVTTHPLVINKLNPAYGKVIYPKGTPVVNALVKLYFINSVTLATLTKNSGEWLIPLGFIVNKKTRNQIIPNETSEVKIEIIDETGEKTVVSADIKNISPLPRTLVLGENYNFLETKDILGGMSSRNKEKGEVYILYPKEKAVIPGGKPLIKGIALPGAELIVEIESKTRFIYKVKADKKGVWRVVPLKELTPGRHKITVITQGRNGEEIRKTRFFTVAKSGETVLGEATGEPTPTEIFPSFTPTPSLVEISPTVVLTATPTTIPTGVNITPSPTEPVSGGSIASIVLTSTSLIVVGLGLLLVF